jgi:LPXTG-motif cell wall-anchored protein
MKLRLVLAALVACGWCAIVSPASAAPSGSATITPTSGPPGSTFNVNGFVMCSSSTMVIALQHGGTTRTSATVSDGSVNTNLTVPAGNPAETDDVTATCDGSSLTLGTFTVTAAPTTTSSTTTTTTTATTATTVPASTTTGPATTATTAPAPASTATTAPATTVAVAASALPRTGTNVSLLLVIAGGLLAVALVLQAARRSAHAPH